MFGADTSNFHFFGSDILSNSIDTVIASKVAECWLITRYTSFVDLIQNCSVVWRSNVSWYYSQVVHSIGHRWIFDISNCRRRLTGTLQSSFVCRYDNFHAADVSLLRRPLACEFFSNVINVIVAKFVPVNVLHITPVMNYRLYNADMNRVFINVLYSCRETIIQIYRDTARINMIQFSFFVQSSWTLHWRMTWQGTDLWHGPTDNKNWLNSALTGLSIRRL